MTLRRVAPIIACAGALVLAGCQADTSQNVSAANRMLRNARRLVDQGSISAARDSATEAATLFHDAGNEEGQGESHQLIADLEGSDAAFEGALAHYATAIREFASAGDKVGVLGAELARMDLVVHMGNEEEAYARGEELLRLAGVTHDVERERVLSGVLLPIARVLGKSDEVERLLKAQLRDADSTGDLKRTAWLTDQQGMSELEAGNAPQAWKTFVAAQALADQARDSVLGLSIALHGGEALVRSGNLAEAMDAYTQALAARSVPAGGNRLRLELLLRLGNVQIRAGRTSEAIRSFQAALTASHDLGDELGRRYAILQMANALRRSQPSPALSLAHQALDGLDASAPPSLMAFAEGTAGLCALAANQPVEAVTSLQNAVSFAEKEWRRPHDDVFADCAETVVGNGRTPWHDELIDLLLRMGKSQDALGIALRRSAWNLFRDLQKITPAVEDPALAALLERWHAERARCDGAEDLLLRSWYSFVGARERAASVATVFARGAADANALAAEIAAAHKPLASFVEFDPPTVPGFEQSLPEGTSLVLYGTTARSLQIFVVTRHGVTAHSVAVDRMPFITRCSAFLDALGDMAEQIDTLTDAPPRSLSRGVLGQSADLYELFVRPVERDLSTARTVLIAESTELPFLPIGSFRRNSMAGTSLIERGSVVYVLPSTMIDLPLPGGPVRDLLAFGSPGLSGRDVEYEVRDIKAAFNDARFLFGPGVSLSSLSGVHADLVHLSLDIRWDSHRPANSFIWMPDPQSTVLKRIPIGALVRIPAFPAVEIHNLARECGPAAGRLAVFPFASGSRLVVLNAAGTGRKSTKAFVEAFSTQLVGGKGVAEAYRAAMLGLLHGGDAVPAFWMPFVLWSN